GLPGCRAGACRAPRRGDRRNPDAWRPRRGRRSTRRRGRARRGSANTYLPSWRGLGLRPLIGGEEVKEQIGGDREGRDRNLIADLQRSEQIREPGIGLDIRAVGARELANAGNDRVGKRIRGGSGQWLILGAR